MYINKDEIENHANSILNKTLQKESGGVAPKFDNAGFSKYGKYWMSGIAVDIRGFKEFVKKHDNQSNIKMIQAYTSSLIKIMKKNNNFRDCYVNGDEVIGVFAADKIQKIDAIMKTAILANSFANYLFPKILKKKNYKFDFSAGVGMWTSNNNSLVMYGEKGTKNDSFSTVIGDIISWSSFLAKKANKNNKNEILFNDLTRGNLVTEKYRNDAKFQMNENSQKIYGLNYRYDKYAEPL